MTKFYLPIPIPKIIETIFVYFLLRYRKKTHGYPFRKIKLTKGKFAKVDPEDYHKLAQYDWHLEESKNRKNCYAVQYEDSRYVKMHRVIMNAPAGKIVDHINGDGLDNTKRNLRIATYAQNSYNKRLKKKGTSKYKGVYFYKQTNKWASHINYNNKRLHLGYFDNEQDAARAYDNAAKIYHGDFAVLNFPDDSQIQNYLAPRP
ncbi:MAG: AP2 domain-containing protein [Sedimentisphaerales bacterium]